jgi:hypothetical protein
MHSRTIHPLRHQRSLGTEQRIPSVPPPRLLYMWGQTTPSLEHIKSLVHTTQVLLSPSYSSFLASRSWCQAQVITMYIMAHPWARCVYTAIWLAASASGRRYKTPAVPFMNPQRGLVPC